MTLKIFENLGRTYTLLKKTWFLIKGWIKMKTKDSRLKNVIWVFILVNCSFQSPQSAPHPGQVIVDPNNPIWLVYNRDNNQDGKLDPFYLCAPGDPEGFFFRGKWDPNTGTRIDGDQQQIINDMKKNGGNGMYLMALQTHGGDAKKTGTLEWQYSNPFFLGDETKKINPQILDQWDGWLTEMDNAGIVVHFFFYDDNIKVSNSLGWSLGADNALHPQEAYFIKALRSGLQGNLFLVNSFSRNGVKPPKIIFSLF